MEKCCANCKYWTDQPNPESEHNSPPVNWRFKFCWMEAGVKKWEEAKARRAKNPMAVLASSPVIHYRGDYGRNCKFFQYNAPQQLTIFNNESSVLHTGQEA